MKVCKSNNQTGRAFAPFQTQWYISGYDTATKYQRLPRVHCLVIDLYTLRQRYMGFANV